MGTWNKRSPRPAAYHPEKVAPCLLCESTTSERERVRRWVWCLDALPCRFRRETGQPNALVPLVEDVAFVDHGEW